MRAEKLINDLLGLEYKSSYDGEYHKIVSSLHKKDIERTVSLLAKETEFEIGKKVGTLEAKVTAYEAIIANSNFAAILIKDGEKPEALTDYGRGYKDGEKKTIDRMFEIIKARKQSLAHDNSEDYRLAFEDIELSVLALKGGDEE